MTKCVFKQNVRNKIKFNIRRLYFVWFWNEIQYYICLGCQNQPGPTGVSEGSLKRPNRRLFFNASLISSLTFPRKYHKCSSFRIEHSIYRYKCKVAWYKLDCCEVGIGQQAQAQWCIFGKCLPREHELLSKIRERRKGKG